MAKAAAKSGRINTGSAKGLFGGQGPKMTKAPRPPKHGKAGK